MPKDRRTIRIAGVGLAVLAAASGCRSTRDEVPPGRSYAATAAPGGAVGFNAQSHMPPVTASRSVGGMGNAGPGYDAMGRRTSGDPTGTIPGAQFGSPGTSGGAAGAGQGGLGQAPPLSGSPEMTPPAGGGMSPSGYSTGAGYGGASPGGAGAMTAPAGGGFSSTGNDPSWGAGTAGAGASPSWGSSSTKSTGDRGGSAARDQSYLNGFSNTPPASGSMGAPGQPPSPL